MCDRLVILRLVLIGAVGLSVVGCAPNEGEFLTASLTEPASLPTSAHLVEQGQIQFEEGNFGTATNEFSKTIEADPLNADAWLGLAASYDQIGRFDEADKAYAKVQQLIGSTPSVLNNMGYSYLLRGDLSKSRTTLAAAYNLDPSNPYIVNNIDILNQRLAALGQAPLSVN